MTITLRRCISENERATKSFITDSDLTLSGYIREPIDIVRPEITIETATNLSLYNYVEIPTLSRKYFATFENTSGNIWKAKLACDVLSSFISDLRSCEAIIERSDSYEVNANMYINDNVYFTEQRAKVTTHHFKKNGATAEFPPNTYNYILCVAGS